MKEANLEYIAFRASHRYATLIKGTFKPVRGGFPGTEPPMTLTSPVTLSGRDDKWYEHKEIRMFEELISPAFALYYVGLLCTCTCVCIPSVAKLQGPAASLYDLRELLEMLASTRLHLQIGCFFRCCMLNVVHESRSRMRLGECNHNVTWDGIRWDHSPPGSSSPLFLHTHKLQSSIGGNQCRDGLAVMNLLKGEETIRKQDLSWVSNVGGYLD